MSYLTSGFQQSERQVGSEIGVSDWIDIDQTLITQFAKLTRDEQWIHTDAERAATETSFGGTIAHGFLTLSLASRFAYDVIETLPGQRASINYGFDKLRFLSPVKAGARVRGRFSLAKVTKKSDDSLLRTFKLVVETEGSVTPALVADWLVLVTFGHD